MSRWSWRWAVLAHVFLLAWMIHGPQTVGGDPGWIAWILLLVSPAIFFLLCVPTFLTHRLLRRRGLSSSRGQIIAQLLVWGGMVGVGVFRGDAGDFPPSQPSLFTRATGLERWASDLIALGCACAGAVAWVALVVLQLTDRRLADRRPTDRHPPTDRRPATRRRATRRNRPAGTTGADGLSPGGDRHDPVMPAAMTRPPDTRPGSLPSESATHQPI